MKIDRIGVMLSVGRHPFTQRSRRSTLDAKALELVLALRALNPNLIIDVVHAGHEEEPALRDYLGMGLERLTLLRTEAGGNIAGALASYFQQQSVDLLFAGSVASDGFGSGAIPYLVARSLGFPLLPEISDVQVQDGRMIAVQARDGGMRHRFRVLKPSLLTVGSAGPEPRFPAFGQGRRGLVEVREPAPVSPCAEASYQIQAAVPMRKPLTSVDPNASAAERLAAVTEMTIGAGQVFAEPDSKAAADRFLSALAEHGVEPEPLIDRP